MTASVRENESKQEVKNERFLKIIFQTQSLRGRKLFNWAIFNSDIQRSVFSFSCFISVCPFVALAKAT